MPRTGGRALALRWVLAVALAISVVGSSAAQEAESPVHTFFAPVEVPLVSVEVYVSDRDGRPVPGLRIGDFEILEDGRPVAISHFFAAPGVEVPEAEEEKEVEEATEVEAGAPEPDDPLQDLYLVIYLDDTNLHRGRRQAALDSVGNFLASELPPGLEVMLVRYDGGLHVEQVFTDDLEEVNQALVRVRESASLSRQLNENRLLRDMDMAVAAAALGGQSSQEILSVSGRSLLQDIDSYVDETVQRIRFGLAEQKRFIRSLSGLSGRKAILLVSDGIESRVGERLYRSWAETFGAVAEFRTDASLAFTRASRNDLGSEFGDLAREANAHRISVYTLSGLGGGQATANSAENRLMDESGLAIQQAMSADVLMTRMAGATGGRPLVNSPALARQLDEVAQELASYYSLAFEPAHTGDGKYHELEVRVKRDGVKVRHREGYLDVPLSDRLDSRTLAAAVHGVGDNPLGISVRKGKVLNGEDGLLLVPIIVMVPIGQLGLVPAEEEHQGRISILLLVRDERGGLSPAHLQQYPVPVRNLDLATALTQSAGFTMRLEVRPGKQRIAVGVRDDIASTESVTTLEIDVSSAEG